ncbi:MAG: hypothetical protein R3231_00615 [bacterium]|nr:hypothetical protein [bacterium]
MSVSHIGIDQTLGSMSRAASEKNAIRHQRGQPAKVQDGPHQRGPGIGQGRRLLAALRSAHAGMNAVARQVRSADSTMGQIGDYVKQMKAQLQTMLKHFPPYPIGSDERVSHMRRFNGFRKIIDQLTVPPREEGMPNIMADPEVHSDAGDWSVTFEGSAQTATIRAQEVHTGPSGLKIPELPETATDDQVQEAIGSLESAEKILGERQQALAADVRMVETSLEVGMVYREMVQSGSASGSDESMETASVMKSLEVKVALSVTSSQAVTGYLSPLSEMME